MSGKTPYCSSCISRKSEKTIRWETQRAMAGSTEKFCTRCETVKPKSEFGGNRRTSDGLQCWCRSCVNLAVKKSSNLYDKHGRWVSRQAKKQNESEARILGRLNSIYRIAIGRALNVAFSKAISAPRLCRSCGKTRPASSFSKGRGQFRKKCGRCMGSYNPDRLWANKLKNKFPGVVVDKEVTRARVRELCGDSCSYCGAPAGSDGHIDHRTPLSRGGPHSYENLCVSCKTCNQVKGQLTAEEFLRSGYLGVPAGGYVQFV